LPLCLHYLAEGNVFCPQTEDLEFWLSNTPAPEAAQSAPPLPPTNGTAASPTEDSTPEKSKKKKAKKEKKSKKQKQHSEYIEAEGITTPSKEQLPANHAPTPAAYKLPPMSSYQTLAENSDLRLVYELRVDAVQSKRIVASVIFVNLTSDHVKDLEFNVLDSLNTKLQRSVSLLLFLLS
jgi:AP-3 complex subunit delta-1